ncbi:MAG: hypothetical protein A3G43_05985 [Ignavibacteria bacterium RIFCSPLOWO2_12_FULL_56_21]|nr:MAG: hypothetical protein A3G43_05985 [Ignavibacteria bacterium RIFCSPLOWO2_12_FULL_56_21]
MTSIKILISLLEQSYDHRSWHGTNLRGSLRGLTPAQAAWRPGKGRHNIWEIAVHCAYWKYIVRRRLLGEKGGSFPLKGSNWFRRPEKLTPAAWRADLRLLEETHRSLLSVVADLDPKHLTRRTPSGTWTHLQTISGIASHDLYHAGQIQLIKRLHRSMDLFHPPV